MAPRRSHRAKPAKRPRRSSATPLLVAAVSCFLLIAATCQAAHQELVLAPNGSIGAWALSGPFRALDSLEEELQPSIERACNAAGMRTIASATGEFDWGETLHVQPNTSAAAVACVHLRFDTEFDGWLLVGAEGRLRVKVDGRSIHRRDQAHARGRAWVPIPLSLGAGTHTLAIELERSSNRSSFSAMLRDRATNQAPSGAHLRVPTALSAQRLTEQLLSFSVRLNPSSAAAQLEVELRFPAAAVNVDLPVWLELSSDGDRLARRWHAGVLRPENSDREPLRILLGPLRQLLADTPSTLTLGIGPSVIKRRLWLVPELASALARVTQVRELPSVLASAKTRHDAVGATLQAHVERVSERLTDPDRPSFDEALQQLEALAACLVQGNDPFQRTGYIDAFIRSPFDQRPTSVLTYVPEARATGSNPALPLVVALHGYNGTPRKILDAFLDRGNANARRVEGLVLAPAAYGNTFYRGAGESAVLEALDWATSIYAVDPSRVYITGVSMGGTGAAELGLKHSHRFAAAAPLCGYQSYFVRRDTANKPVRRWELPLMHRFSPASFAENGSDLPMFVAQGLKDLPLENSRVLTKRYRALGNHLEEDWPNLGHSVWTKSYRNAAMYTWLTRWTKDLEPRHVLLASDSLRHGTKFWLEITKLDAGAEPGLLDARIVSPTTLEVKTRGIKGFRVGPTRHLDASHAIQTNIDGQPLLLDLGQERSFEQVDGLWRLKPSAPKPLALEGPWSELFAQPFAVVYGTLDPSTLALNREVATRLVEPRPGVDLRIPVVADRDFDVRSSQLTRLVYVGTIKDHALLARIMDKLPLRNTDQGLRLGARVFAEPDVGAAFVYPDPERPVRLLGVVTGNSPEGLWRVLALPALVPDFVVFDHGIDAAAGESILGTRAFVRAAGFFRDDWSLPEDFSDPLEPKAR